MVYILLSYFDYSYGPKHLFVYPETSDDWLKNIPKLIDTQTKGFFIHSESDYQTANHIFTIADYDSRGGYELFQISIIVKTGLIHRDVAKQVLEHFIDIFSQIKDIKKGLYRDRQSNPVFDEMKNIFYEYFTNIESMLNALFETEKNLQESEARWRSLINNAPVFVTIVNNNYKIQFINRVVPGLKIEKVIGDSLLNYIAPEFHDIARKQIDYVFKTKNKTRYESKATGPNKKRSYYANHVGPIIINNKVTAVTIIGIDITEIKRTEEELKLSNEIIKQTFDNTIDGIRIIDTERNIIQANNVLFEQTGLSAEEVIGKKCFETMGNSRCNSKECTLEKILNGSEKISIIGELFPKNKPKFKCLITAKALKNNENETVGIIEYIRELDDEKEN